jgi:hypothetical protein
LSTPADPTPAAKSASSQGMMRRPKYDRSDPRTPRLHPNAADAPSAPKAMPEAPSEMESEPMAEMHVVPNAVKISRAR